MFLPPHLAVGLVAAATVVVLASVAVCVVLELKEAFEEAQRTEPERERGHSSGVLVPVSSSIRRRRGQNHDDDSDDGGEKEKHFEKRRTLSEDESLRIDNRDALALPHDPAPPRTRSPSLTPTIGPSRTHTRASSFESLVSTQPLFSPMSSPVSRNIEHGSSSAELWEVVGNHQQNDPMNTDDDSQISSGWSAVGSEADWDRFEGSDAGLSVVLPRGRQTTNSLGLVGATSLR
ncbi:hypothetical protein P7C70_g1100, partial [Phenoliferia sp. Uapishka_3]